MYHITDQAHDSRRGVLSPPWGAILVAALVAAVVPLVVMAVLSNPSFGVAILAFGMLAYALLYNNRVDGRFVQPVTGQRLEAVRPDNPSFSHTKSSKANR